MKAKSTILRILCCCFFIVSALFQSYAQNRPFPQQIDWNGCIKPNNVSQQQMNTSVQNMYNYWKSNFLKPTNLPGGYYVKGGCTGCTVPSKGTSEGHGYGMIITALMGGYDTQAKIYFDGLYKFFDTHRSTINAELMGWNVAVDERTNSFSSAADGDMDIAYALLLAHYQWGSGGSINYLQEAKDMITRGIKASLIHPSSLRVMMGDWDNNALETRSSDWMTAHLRAYQKATGDVFWDNVANSVYQMIDQLNTNNLGILPDFVDGNPARPDANNATGEPNSQDYYWNACRTPMRISTDFAHYGTEAAKTQSNRFVNWAKTDIGTNFGRFASGYNVNGQVVGSRYGPAAFVAPLVVASITNSANQNFLNVGWDYIKNKQEDYYGASINLLSMLVISGNWWLPEPETVNNQPPTVNITAPTNDSTYNAPASIQINVTASDQDGSISKVEFYNGRTKIGQDVTAPYTYNWKNIASGSYTLTAKATDNQGASKMSSPIFITVNTTSQQAPYGGTLWSIPGKIEAENYDLGGQNVAFNDVTNANEGGSYRSDLVDIEPCSEGGYNVGWIKSGEWLEYTVNVAESKTYILESRVAAISTGRRFHVEIDGQDVSGPINVPNTNGWQNWQTVTSNVFLNRGQQVLRIVMDSNDFNLNRLEFFNADTPVNQLPVCSIINPLDNQIFEEGSQVAIKANATDSDGRITKVEFFRNSTLISTDSSVPYEYTISSIQEGTYSLTIKAYDDQGAFTVSSPVSITVNRPGGGSTCSAAQYVDGNVYTTGEKVQNQGKEYECLVGGWCSLGGPYEPGRGWAWPNAWKEIGNCGTSFSSLDSIKQSYKAICDVAPYQDGAAYQAGDEVQNFGKKFRCKVAGWCSLGGPYTPGTPNDWAWPSAWDEIGPCDGGSDNQLPIVNITSPEEGTQYQFGDEVVIKVDASDPDGSIAKVTFVVDGIIVGEDTSAPYEFSFVPDSSGNHNLLAEAVDDKGSLNNSSSVGIFVIEAGDCDAETYQDGNTYQTGDEVANLGYKYRCLVGGWCSVGGAYTPGGPEDWAWPLAWEKLGPCAGGNTPPEVTVLTPTIVYADALPVTVPFRIRAKDPDGLEFPIYMNVPGGALPLLAQGNDEYEADWSFYEYKVYTYSGTAVDIKGAVTQFEIEITIKERTQGGDFLISRQEYNDLFPYRYGVDLETLEIDPAKDFFTYEAFVEAIERMKNIEVTFERRKGTNLYRLTRKDKATGQTIVIRTDQDFDASWNQSKPIMTQIVDYGMFSNEGSEVIRKRELAAFFANIAQETTGGWDTAPGGRYAWGLYFREEVNPGSSYTVGSTTYPAVPGQSYHGRGPIQLSYNYNYGQVSEFLFGDKNVLLSNPERVLQDGALAFQTAIWFWMTPQYPKPSAHDVMVGNWTPTANDLERNRKPGFGMTINIINGGVECGEGYEELKPTHRIGHYKKFTGIFNVSTDLDNNDCSECGCGLMEPMTGIEPEALTRTLQTIESTKMNMFPNPFEDKVSITFELKQNEIVSIHASDLRGNQFEKEIKNKRLTEGTYTFSWDTSKYPKGIYFYKVMIGKNTKVFKLVKR